MKNKFIQVTKDINNLIASLKQLDDNTIPASDSEVIYKQLDAWSGLVDDLKKELRYVCNRDIKKFEVTYKDPYGNTIFDNFEYLIDEDYFTDDYDLTDDEIKCVLDLKIRESVDLDNKIIGRIE